MSNPGWQDALLDGPDYIEERLVNALTRQRMQRVPRGTHALVSPQDFTDMVRRLGARVEYDDTDSGWMTLFTPHGKVMVGVDDSLEHGRVTLERRAETIPPQTMPGGGVAPR